MDDEDQKYGIPELKKFPMPDAKHVRSAIKFFNYVTPAYEKQLATAILLRMREYDMSFDDFEVGEENRFSKYIPKHLEHHGILGQKWGIRRYQNKDGSLTEVGKKRYGDSGLTDRDAARLEKNISTLHENSTNARRSYKQEKTLREKKAKANKEVTKVAFDLAKKSKELVQILDEAKEIEAILDEEGKKFESNKKLVRETANKYIKERNITSESAKKYYRELGGIDAAANLWTYYCSNNKRLNSLSERQYALSQSFMNKTETVTKELLGEYGKKKLSQVSWSTGSPTVSEYLANQLNNRFYDYIWYGDTMFERKK